MRAVCRKQKARLLIGAIPGYPGPSKSGRPKLPLTCCANFWGHLCPLSYPQHSATAPVKPGTTVRPTRYTYFHLGKSVTPVGVVFVGQRWCSCKSRSLNADATHDLCNNVFLPNHSPYALFRPLASADAATFVGQCSSKRTGPSSLSSATNASSKATQTNRSENHSANLYFQTEKYYFVVCHQDFNSAPRL